jgi:phosphate transport system permease protein
MSGKKVKEKTIKSILFLCAAFSIVLVLSIIGYLVFMGGPAVTGFFLQGTRIFDGTTEGPGNQVLIAMGSTVYLAGGATILALIVGLPSAIYMAEFAQMRVRNFVKTTFEVLDGLPSIVIGLLGWELLVYPSTKYSFSYFLRTSSHMQFEGCTLFGWLILMLMTFPIIATVSEDALRAVSQDLREASLGLGATKWQTTKEVLIPGAMPRIVASTLLGFAAACGEMVALAFVLNGTIYPPLVASPSYLILNPFIQTKTLSIIMENGYMSAMDSTGSPEPCIYAIGFILFLMIGAILVATRITLANRGNKGTE